MDGRYVDEAVAQLAELCAIPSPTGYTSRVCAYVTETLRSMGYAPSTTRKGAVLADLGGAGSPLVLAAHVDTLGAMVRSVKDNGRLRPTGIGGFNWHTADGENCTVHTRSGGTFDGVILHKTPSMHVSGKDVQRAEEEMEVLLDHPASSKEEVAALGIRPGDFIAADPRTRITPSGVIKSRFLDDKASAGILIALARYLKEEDRTPERKVWLMFTSYEEVGHGASAGIPEDAEELVSVDMGAVGDDLGANERMVSICAKDSMGPYDYAVTTALIETAERLGLSFAVDTYPLYGSDAQASLRAGYDVRHGLIGPGVYSSHNYERTHRDALEQTLRLIAGYIGA